jgi:hypothetical protein
MEDDDAKIVEELDFVCAQALVKALYRGAHGLDILKPELGKPVVFFLSACQIGAHLPAINDSILNIGLQASEAGSQIGVGAIPVMSEPFQIQVRLFFQ